MRQYDAVRGGRAIVASVWAALAVSGVACGAAPALDGGDAARWVLDGSGAWECPPAWVRSASGGCGPAVILCASPVQAAPGACVGIDVRDPRAGPFHRAPDGGIAGDWPSPGEPDGPPLPTFEPDAGIANCRAGWRRTPAGGCDVALRTDCEAGAIALPDGTCTPTGEAACSVGEYADPGPRAIGARVVHVRAGADALMADGSAALPFATLSAGATNAGAGGWVLLADGSYEASLDVGSELHVVGRCAARVTLRGPNGRAAVTAIGTGATVELAGVTVAGGTSAVEARDGAHATLTGVVAHDAGQYAVAAQGAGTDLRVTSSVIRDTQIAADGTGGLAAYASIDARITLDRVAAVRNRQIGVAANLRGRLTLTDVRVSDTLASPDGRFGVGIGSDSGATVDITGSLADGNRVAGILGTGGSHVAARDTIVRDTLLDRQNFANGVDIENRSDAVLDRVTILRSGRHGIYAGNTGTSVRFTAGSIEHVNLVPGTEYSGVGVIAAVGAQVEITGVHIDSVAAVGFGATGAQTHVTAREVVVTNVQFPTNADIGVGISALYGGSVDVTRALLAQVAGAGAVSRSADSLVRIRESVIRSPRFPGEGWGAIGLGVDMGGSIEADRLLIDGAILTGALAQEAASTVSLARSVVQHVVARGTDFSAAGVWALAGGHARLEHVRVANGPGFGVSCGGAGARMDLVDVGVERITSGSTGVFGHGVYVEEGGVVDAHRLAIVDTVEGGLVVFGRGSNATLEDVWIDGVSPSRRGFGIALIAFGQAAIAGTRVAIERCSGAAVGAVPIRVPERPFESGATTVVHDLYVGRVRSATVVLDHIESSMPTPAGRAVAYGLHVGEASRLDVARALFSEGGYGFFAAHGTLRLESAVIARQLDGAAAFGGQDTMLILRDVLPIANARDDVVQLDELPQASALPPPSPVCLTPPCP